ncbi:MAG TPA: S41 family peptidase [bacterium]|nr:S41 family peptidase [bacterium]
MRKKFFLTIIGFFLLTIILGSDVKVSEERNKKEETYKNIELFIDALNIVEKNYVKEVENKDLIYGALKGMLMSLDPYSAFLPPDLKKELQIETEGQFEGVGMEITLKNGIITVVSPIEDSPAWKAGVKPGDRIITIDGESTKGMTTLEAAKKLRGEKGTKVKISVMRENMPKLIDIEITRDIIKVKSVKTEDIGEMGYIRITEFQERTSSDLKNALEEFNKKEKKGIILDLRNNPGGLLTSAVEVSELFLQKGKLIVYTQGRNKEDKSIFRSKKVPIWEKPIVLLVNQGSASASEIVFGALKDNYEKISSVGEKTFGKGSVQNLIPLSDGSALKLTIAYYYTPSNVCIEGEGIPVDYEVKLPEDKEIIFATDEDVQFQEAKRILKNMIYEKDEKE